MKNADRIARVFPSITSATPRDALAFFDAPGLFPPDVSAVHVSVTFSWDIPRAEWLAKQWSHVAPVEIGGPAIGTRGGQFEPGMYIREGYVITSRGCPNRCWFCSVWKRDGNVRELEIRDGWNLLDDNLLACSEDHIRGVFSMLARVKRDNPGTVVEFTGGLEAARLEPWHVEELRRLRPRQMFFAYDTPDDLAPLQRAGEMLREGGWRGANQQLRCYVLVGGPNDSIADATDRLHDTVRAGFLPMAMLYRDSGKNSQSKEWRHLQRLWARPAIMAEAVRKWRVSEEDQ